MSCIIICPVGQCVLYISVSCRSVCPVGPVCPVGQCVL